MRRSWKPPNSGRGFSLIELLVVIAIIAVLASLLFPVYAGVKGKARQTKCLSNLKQVGAALMMYVHDWNDTYPYDLKPRMPARPDASPAYDGTNAWDGSPIAAALWKYLKSIDVCFCPDHKEQPPDVGPMTNYEFNAFIALNANPLAPHRGPVKASDLKSPSRVLAFEDYSDSPHYHAGFRNFAMCDGGARAYSSSLQGARPCHGKWWVP